MLSGLSGNIVVLKELIAQHNLNIDARLMIDLREIQVERGATALAVSVGLCPQSNVHAIVAAMLAAGADPNATDTFGNTALMAAVSFQSVDGVRALIKCAYGKLDFERENSNNATVLSVAALISTTAIVEELVQAGADRNHVTDGGSNKLTDACSNPAADVRMLEILYLTEDGRNTSSAPIGINDQTAPRTMQWGARYLASRKAVRLGAAQSLLMMGRAHCEGSTSLHMSAKSGNPKLVEFLLRNGAQSSLRIKNKMGCLPIDLAKVFGPHPEVEGLLAAAMFKSSVEQPTTVAQPIGGAAFVKRFFRTRPQNQAMDRLHSSWLQAARSGETAIPMQYDMWLMPAAEFITLSELRPHQELRAAGKLVRWNAKMKSVFFLSHQWTSFERPDYSTVQLRTIQKLLVRMLRGELPTTEPSFVDAVRLPSGVKISTREWKELVSGAFLWVDYISVPQMSTTYTELSTEGAGQASDLMKAVNSIPAYVERSSHFFAIVPTVRNICTAAVRAHDALPGCEPRLMMMN